MSAGDGDELPLITVVASKIQPWTIYLDGATGQFEQDIAGLGASCPWPTIPAALKVLLEILAGVGVEIGVSKLIDLYFNTDNELKIAPLLDKSKAIETWSDINGTSVKTWLYNGMTFYDPDGDKNPEVVTKVGPDKQIYVDIGDGYSWQPPGVWTVKL